MKKLPNVTKQEIQTSVDEGKIINWKNRSYQVVKKDNQYIILYSDKKYSIPLDKEFTESETNSFFFEGDELKTYYQASLNQDDEETIHVSKNEKYSKPDGNYFESKDDALAHFTLALNEARIKFDNLKEKYYQFCKENNMSVSYSVEGDTHGVIDFMYMTVESNGYKIDCKL